MQKLRFPLKSKFYACLIIFFFTIIAFESVRKNNFIYKGDQQYVVNNHNIKAGLTLYNVKWALTTTHLDNWHPIAWLSHIIDYELFNSDPVGHHFVNLLFHLFSSILLFLVLYKTTSNFWPGLFVALMFAVHPLNVQPVAWIAARKDILSGLFAVLSLWAYIRYVSNKSSGRYMLVIMFYVLGLMSKSILVTLPLIFIAFDYWPLERFNIDDKSQWKTFVTLLVEKIPMFCLALGSAIITIVLYKQETAWEQAAPFYLRFSNALLSYVLYLWKMIFPKNLALFYPYPFEGIPFLKVLFAFIFLSGITTLVIVFIRKKYLAVGWFIYICMLFPVIGFVQINEQAMSDHYMYLPSIGIFIIICWTIYHLLKEKNLMIKRIAILSGFLVVFILVLYTRKQVTYWKNSHTLFTHTLKITENNYMVHNNMGIAYSESKNYKAAMQHFEKSLKIQPNQYLARSYICKALLDMKDYEGAIKCYKELTNYTDAKYKDFFNLGMAFLETEKYLEAIKYFSKVLEHFDPNPDIYIKLGVAYANLEQYKNAEQNFYLALTLEAENINACENLGLLYQKTGKIDKALKIWSKLLHLKNVNPNTYFKIGARLASADYFEEAIVFYNKALSIRPAWLEVQYNLGNAYLLSGKDSIAERQFMKVLQLNPNFLEANIQLARIKSIRGEKEDAIYLYKKAYILAERVGNKELVDRIRNILQSLGESMEK